jgi:CBS domain-containing membrane protein
MRISELGYSDFNILNEDIIEAMKEIPGYLDITPEDCLELYNKAYRHALDRLKATIKAEHIMTTSVVTIDENKSLADAAQLMADFDVSGLPVIDRHGKVSGVISEKDFLKHMNVKEQSTFMNVILCCLDSPDRCLARDLKGLLVKDVMSSPLINVGIETPVLKVADLLESKKINRVPVLNQELKLVGIIARSDLVRALS